MRSTGSWRRIGLPRTDFLMIVTPVDLAIARYSIPALARLVASSECIHAVI